MSKITLYENSNYQGRTFEAVDDIENLKNYGFNDIASSCKIDTGTWMLYKDSNFQGQCSILQKGNYDSSSAMGLPNDTLSSLRPYPQDSGTTILLFKDTDFRGEMITLTGAESNLKNLGFNDKTSSVIVLSGTWDLYQDTNFKGTSWSLSSKGGTNGDGHYPTYEFTFTNDAVSSAKPK